MTFTVPSRSARRSSSGGTSRTAIPFLSLSVARSDSADGPGCTPTSTSRSARDGKAMASASDMTIGNTNAQNTASGSRMNSRNRASVSWTSAAEVRSLIAEVPSRQRHEHVLQRPMVSDHLGLAEPRNQLFRRSFRNNPPVIDDRHPIAQKLGFVHVMGRHQDGAATRAELIEQSP